jgi:hypothetical protein
MEFILVCGLNHLELMKILKTAVYISEVCNLDTHEAESVSPSLSGSKNQTKSTYGLFLGSINRRIQP